MLRQTKLSYFLIQSFNIYKLRKNVQNKVFNFIEGHQQQYLRQFKQFSSQEALQTAILCMQKANQSVRNDIIQNKYSIKLKKTNINAIKKELDQSFLELKKKMEHIRMSHSQIDVYVKDQQKLRNNKQAYQKLKKLRQKDVQNDKQKQKSVSQFLQKISIQKRKHEQKYKKSLSKSQSQIQNSLQNQKKQKTQRIKKIVKTNIQKYQNRKQHQIKLKQDHLQKQKHILQFLNIFKSKKPIHQKLQQQYIQNIVKLNQQQYKKKLNQIHEQRKVIPLKQFLYHKQQIQQVIRSKSSQNQQKIKRYLQFTKDQQKKLGKLFHSRHHKNIKNQNKQPIFDDKLFKRQMKMKMLSYSEQVSKKYEPIIDQSKRIQIQKILSKSSRSKKDRKYKKISSFSNQFIDQGQKLQLPTEDQIGPRQKGLQYLQFIREENKAKIKKKQNSSNSSKQVQGKKIYDRSLQKKNHYKIKRTLSQWKRALEKKDISKVQKKELIQNYSIKLNLEKIKLQQQSRNQDKDISKQIQINAQLQKCYIQQLKSKLTLLKL